MKRIEFRKHFIFVLLIFVLLLAIVLPFFAIITQKKNIVLSIFGAIMPLISFFCIYFFIKYSVKKTGKSLRLFLSEKTEALENDAMLLQKILSSSELAVLTTIYTDVILLKKSRLGISKSYSIYRYVGKIKTGIDFNKCKFNVDYDNQKILVKLPSVKIFDHFIDIENIEKFDEKTSLFCKISNTELFAEISRRKAQAERRLIEHGLLEATETRVKMELTQMFAAMGYIGYDIAIAIDKKEGLLPF